MIKSYNDLVYAIAKRAKELGNEKVDTLRLIAGYNCDTENQARQMNKYETRGSLIDIILTEEFVEETDKDFEE
jgi:hypothetical protein